ncbi:CDP-glycerol glycerophosphotransferase family protein [Anaerofustis stercorihominis]|uniref:CDP-glycerol glycerophosphotransferase family protein n=1 Tax=Anaerofustis stercorihominis TaxID=214853 RepID=UPI00214BD01C|nr:CDP-glycerol glycerophosphotransferase family protein [Anaerofustis stercorihominis]MCR2033211.1 CDP-glycerol glycerophosphotransferase family protein [Anaerofustis stercorihominis]
MVKNNIQCAYVDDIEFKRIVLHVRGTLEGFDDTKDLKFIFITEDGLKKVYPLLYGIEGNKFHIMLNVMSCNDQYPIRNGIYYLRVYKKGNEKELYPFYLNDANKYDFSDKKDNPINLYIEKNSGSYFFGRFYPDLDTKELCLDTKALLLVQKAGVKYYLVKIKSSIKKFISNVKKWLFIQIFNICSKLIKRKGNKILISSASRVELGGNEKFIYDRMIDRGLNKKYKFRFDFKPSIKERRGIFQKFKFAFYLATSDIIIIDDYYPEIYKVNYPKDVKIIQIWHACGAFKSLGLERMDKPGAPPFNTRVHKCYTHVPVSSFHSALHHSEAFGLSLDKFYPIGVPRTDIFFDENYKAEILSKLYKKYSVLKHAKKTYLYAPTFRGNNAKNAYFPFYKLDLEKWGAFLKEHDSVLIIKMHPFVEEHPVIPEEYKDYIIDAGDYREVNDILFAVDVLITDYSSVIYEFSLLNRPMVFYAFDQQMYVSTRDFYERYEDIVPGKIVKTFDDLIKALEDEDYDFEKMDAFVKKNFTYTDGKSTDRVIDQLILDKK